MTKQSGNGCALLPDCFVPRNGEMLVCARGAGDSPHLLGMTRCTGGLIAVVRVVQICGKRESYYSVIARELATVAISVTFMRLPRFARNDEMFYRTFS